MNENALRGIEIEVDTLLKTFAPCKELEGGGGGQRRAEWTVASDSRYPVFSPRLTKIFRKGPVVG